MIIKEEELQTLFKGYNAYLVGGGARHILALQTAKPYTPVPLPRDWDVVIDGPSLPMLTNASYTANSFGGRKYDTLGMDVWKQNIGRFLRMVPRYKDGLAYHLETGMWLFTREFTLGDGKVTGREVVKKEGNS